jgi:hypothetical protein
MPAGDHAIGRERVTVRFRFGRWSVDCTVCTGALMLVPWAVCADERVAQLIARWHVERHRDQRCDCCGHTPPIPSPVVFSNVSVPLVRIGDDVWKLTQQGLTKVVL